MSTLIISFRNFANAPKNDDENDNDKDEDSSNNLCPDWMTSDTKLTGVEYSNVMGSDVECVVSERKTFSF